MRMIWPRFYRERKPGKSYRMYYGFHATYASNPVVVRYGNVDTTSHYTVLKRRVLLTDENDELHKLTFTPRFHKTLDQHDDVYLHRKNRKVYNNIYAMKVMAEYDIDV